MIGGKVHPEDTMVQSSRHDHGLEPHRSSSKIEPSRGLEPAVRGCGYMTTHSFMKLQCSESNRDDRRTRLLDARNTATGSRAQEVTFLTAAYQGGHRWLLSATGHECDTSSLCTKTLTTRILLTGSAFCAGALFAGIVICIFAKCYATRYFFHHSWIQLIIDFEPTHDLHTSFGTMSFVAGLLHGILHIARFVITDDMHLLYSKGVNRSGVVATLLLLPTALPMAFAWCRKRLTFEFRKVMHMMLVPFMIALCFHTKLCGLIFSIVLIWYLLDRLYFTTRQTFLIERPLYKAVGRGTLVRMDLPRGYQFKAGSYAQVNCPAISTSEWHPFSLFPVPGSRNRAGMHIEAVGDWTQELFRLGLESPQMPLWITAAQPSSIEKTIYFENVLLICTGAGITPAVSAANRFAKKKNIHLLWMSREASMVALFEKQLRRVKSTVHVTGKPNSKTKGAMLDLFTPSAAERARVTSRTGRSLSREVLPSEGHSRGSSFSDLTVLESGLRGLSRSYRSRSLSAERGDGREGAEREEKTDGGGSDDEESNLGSCFSITARVEARQHHERKEQQQPDKRYTSTRGYHPVTLKFGRPDISRFIAETVQYSTAPPSPDWSEVDLSESIPKRPVRLAQVIERLNTGQRLSKHDLMQVDMEMVETSKNNSRGHSRSNSRSNSRRNLTDSISGDTGSPPVSNPGDWLVVYSGANGTVEKAISSVCEELKVTWRKEYFSTW